MLLMRKQSENTENHGRSRNKRRILRKTEKRRVITTQNLWLVRRRKKAFPTLAAARDRQDSGAERRGDPTGTRNRGLGVHFCSLIAAMLAPIRGDGTGADNILDVGPTVESYINHDWSLRWGRATVSTARAIALP
ncbi:hypothetical protein BHE74_00021196 [Ensete ventricosum]|nr:hypothetical protein GW17_00038539 [Ensete ventricosum]RWW71084.1 hypothetical protein BHE74_00021196 [Ensete ventricosum]